LEHWSRIIIFVIGHTACGSARGARSSFEKE
jgi:carbonic anhydrase